MQSNPKQSTAAMLAKLNINNESSELEHTQATVSTSLDNISIHDPKPSAAITEKKIEELSLFSYDKLNNYLTTDNLEEVIKENNYIAQILPDNQVFIGFSCGAAGKKATDEGRLFDICGLKFNVSLPEDNKEELKIGWDIVREILIKNEVCSFKIIRDGFKMSDKKDQYGKVVTVYAGYNPEKTTLEWEKIMQDITQQLTSANISPGYRNPGIKSVEKPIGGSNYLTYRYHDELKKLKKISNKEIKAKTDPQGWPLVDPISKIKVDVLSQLPIPEWKDLAISSQEVSTQRESTSNKM